jgi:MFS transporter, ACS family, hexuronate transporter
MGLGLFEAGNFPAAIKTVAEWFPKKERSLAIGIFNSGSNVGAILAPILVPLVVVGAQRVSNGRFGWQAAFCVTGILELIWICFWVAIYRKPEEHPKVSRGELNYIMSDPPDPAVKIPWLRLFPYSQTWAFSVAKFLTDPVWWFWLFWAAPYLSKTFGMDIKHIGLPLIVIYCLASVGSIGGGWIASGLARTGMSVNMCRKLALLICAICVVPVTIVSKVPGEWPVVLLIGLAAAAHQGFSANLFALSGDLFPRKAVGSVVGIGGMLGAVGGMLFQWAAGRVVDRWGTYLPLFVYAGLAYLVSITIIQLLSPRLEQAAV